MLSQKRLRELEKIANRIREDIITSLLAAKSGHSAGPLGMAEVMTALYFEIAKITPKTRGAENRDRVVLSNAHICPVLYATLANRGYFPRTELKTLRKLGSRLQGHSNNHFRPDLPIETSGGPLGQGLSQAIGMALASRMNKLSNDRKSQGDHIGSPLRCSLLHAPCSMPTWHTWALLSDGELDEGQTWEAIMFAGKNDLREVTAFVDRNNIQIDGFTENIMPLEPLAKKFEAFNWTVVEVDGHNLQEIIDAADRARAVYENPTVIICHTIPGKGVDFMENKYEWHGKPPNEEEGRIALKELRTLGGQITSEHE